MLARQFGGPARRSLLDVESWFYVAPDETVGNSPPPPGVEGAVAGAMLFLSFQRLKQKRGHRRYESR